MVRKIHERRASSLAVHAWHQSGRTFGFENFSSQLAKESVSLRGWPEMICAGKSVLLQTQWCERSVNGELLPWQSMLGARVGVRGTHTGCCSLGRGYCVVAAWHARHARLPVGPVLDIRRRLADLTATSALPLD